MPGSALTDLLASYVPRLIQKRIIADPRPIEAPALDRLQAIVLFADISGFTRLTEQTVDRGPTGVEAIADLLNKYFGALIRIVHAYGGDVVKFAGDAIIAIWPIEDPRPSAYKLWAVKAAECALEIREKLHRYQIEDQQMRIKIALSMGAVNQLHLGGIFNRWEVLITGRPLIELGIANGLASPGEILLTPSIWSVLQGAVTASPFEFQGVDGAADAARLESMERHAGEDVEPADIQLPVDAEPSLKAYIPGAVINRLSAGHSGWLAELRKVTVLFINLPNLHEDTPLDAAQTMTRLLQRSVYRYEGSLNKISVDEKGTTVVAALGLPPLSHEDDPVRALRIALAVRDELIALGLRSAIGITTGRIFCGAIGNQERREYTIIGNIVNLSARLMTLAAGSPDLTANARVPIICDRATYESARELIEFESLPAQQVKGREGSVEVFHALSQRKTLIRPETELIGRTEEKAILAKALEELVLGAPAQTIVISGEAGIGKSRLTEHLLRQASLRNIRTLVGAGDAIDKSTPYHAWRPVFASLFGLEDALDRPELLEVQRLEIRERVVERIREVDPDLVRYAPLVSVVLPIDIPENEFTSSMSGEIRGGNIREVLVRLLNHEAARSPLLIVLQDLHWLDSASWTLLLDAQHKVAPALRVLNTRPMTEPDFPEHAQLIGDGNTQVVRLEVLPLDDVETLVCRRLGVRATPPEIGKLIREKSEGHPFFAEELAYALRDNGIIQIQDEECRLSSRFATVQEITLPDSLQAAIISRIDSLTPSQQLTLKAASVIGRIFAFRLLNQIYPVEEDRPALPGHMETLTRLSLTLIESPEPDLEYIFKHAITQEVAYNLMLYSQRRLLHRSLARSIERTFGQDISAYYTLLAYHWVQAAGSQEGSADRELTVRALHYLEKAGDQSLNNFANAEAIHFFKQALALSDQIRIKTFRRARWYRKLGQAYLGLGRLQEAHEHFLTALRLFGRPVPTSGSGMITGLLAQIARQTAHRLWPAAFLGRVTDQRQHAAGLEIVQIHVQLATVLFLIADPDPLPLFFSVIANLNVAEGIPETPMLGYVYAQMGSMCGFIPARSQYRHYRQRADELLQRFEHAGNYVGAHVALGAYESGIGMWRDLEPRLEQAIAHCERIGDNRQAGEALAYLASNAELSGDVRLLDGYNRRLWESAMRRENPVQVLWSKQLSCSIAATLGRPDESIRIAGEALDAMHKTWVGEVTEIVVRSALNHALWQKGEHEQAWTGTKTLLDRLAKASVVDYSIYLAYSHLMTIAFDALERSRDRSLPGVPRAEAETYARLSIRMLKRYCAIFDIGAPAYDRLRGEMAWHQGRREKAYRLWRAGAEKAAAFPMYLEEGKAQLALARYLPSADPERGRRVEQARLAFERGGLENWTDLPEKQAG